MKTKYIQKDSSPKREWENVAISNEYIDNYIKKYTKINPPAKAIIRSISMHNDKSQKKIGTSINWMPKEPAKNIEEAHPPPKVKNLKQAYGTCTNWNPEFRFKAGNSNKRENSMQTKYGQFMGKRINNSFLPDIHKNQNKKSIFNTRSKASPPKRINKTFGCGNNKNCYKNEENDENETAFDESGIGYHITRKNSNLYQPFADKFVGKLNLMFYDFNGYNKKQGQPNKFNSPSITHQIYQKTLSCFNSNKKGNQSKVKRDHANGSPKQCSIEEDYIANENKPKDPGLANKYVSRQAKVAVKSQKDGSNNSLLKWSKCDNEIDEKLSEESN